MVVGTPVRIYFLPHYKLPYGVLSEEIIRDNLIPPLSEQGTLAQERCCFWLINHCYLAVYSKTFECQLSVMFEEARVSFMSEKSE